MNAKQKLIVSIVCYKLAARVYTVASYLFTLAEKLYGIAARQ